MKQRADLTFKFNQEKGRHGWLRLTPAYSIKAVLNYLDTTRRDARVLDPFSGTGTTGLLCSELGIESTLIEINPFLVWLAKVKTRNYTAGELATTESTAKSVTTRVRTTDVDPTWIPAIHAIERWWTPKRLRVLAQLFECIRHQEKEQPPAIIDLLKVGFCRLIIQWSNAAFNHQSMSFKEPSQQLLFELDDREEILNSFEVAVKKITESAHFSLPTEAEVIEGDSRHVGQMTGGKYTQVITSPPYPNRMSYIRELRPYMYWLGYLAEAKEAGELDWRAIGGTWGIATSKLSEWTPGDASIAHSGFDEMLNAIAESPNSHSAILAKYVHRYFLDVIQHLSSLRMVMQPGAEIVYIVGNSKFYDVLVPVEQIYTSVMLQCGFSNTRVETLRKRNSKKELCEFAVIAYT